LTVSLRGVRAEDEALLRQLAAARRPELAGLPANLLAAQDDAQRRDYAARFPGAVEQVVVRDGRAIGRLWVDRSPGAWRLLDVVLLPEARGAGIGTAVLTGLLDDADAAGAVVRLTVDAGGDPARRLYARLGFATVADDGVHEVMERPPHAPARRPARG
jgi:ribosomal protein S18 acetylase RimI-like enzyme